MFKYLPGYIRSAVLIFATVVAIASAAITASVMYRNDVDQSETSAKEALNIWKNKIEGSRQNGRIVNKYEQDYFDMVRKNIIGNENRLSWYEVIQHITDERNLFSVKYSVYRQKKVETPTLRRKYSGIDLYVSAMTIDMVMADENDLFAMLNALQDKAKGLFTVDKCNIELVSYGDKSKNELAMNRMKAHCELSWYTIKSARKAW